MSGQKQCFLWLIIIFCATFQITSSDQTSVQFNSSFCPAVNVTQNKTFNENFCTRIVHGTDQGKCQTDAGITLSFNITNNGSHYIVTDNKNVIKSNQETRLMDFLSDFLPLSIYQNLTGSQFILYVHADKKNLTLSVTCINSSTMINCNKTSTPAASTPAPTSQAKTSTPAASTPAPTSQAKTSTPAASTPAPTSQAKTSTPAASTPAPTSQAKTSTPAASTPAPTSQARTSTPAPTSISNSPSKASEMLDKLKEQIVKMEANNQSTAPIEKEGVIGFLYRQDRNTKPKDIIVLNSSDRKNITIIESQNVLQTNGSWYVKISEEAFNKSRLEHNGSTFVGVLQFKNMENNDKTHTVLNNEVYGISMGAEISNLTDKIEIVIQHKQQRVDGAFCSSWSGKGELNWTTSGCDTEINKNEIKCSCSHLTFFAVLMSIPSTNISAADVESLSYISNIGCGFSMFFLGIALFMHFLLRKCKSNQATKILINMFVALFLLNLSFLCNESIANTQDSAACTVTALIMHYSMLATFTWFFLQALHMYLWLIRQNITIKNYMRKIMVSGWVCPSLIVVIIACAGEYKSVTIISTNYKVTRMCWITNHYIHYIVNIGYYALVFIFTTVIFIILVTKIIQSRNVKVGEVKRSTFRKQLVMVLSLFVLLGLTWGVAFFSYGDMTVPSYYIFCVLNSFQGFFLFLYYYHIHNDVEGRFSDDPDGPSTSVTDNQSSTDTVAEHSYT